MKPGLGFLFPTVFAMALAILALFLCTLPCSAQSTGTVTGTVKDQSAAVVPNAKVELTNEATKDVRQTTSNESGYFSFGVVSPGTYTVKVIAAAFKSFERKGLIVRVGDVRDLNDIALQIGTENEVIEVAGVADEIAPVDSGERSAVLTSKQIENLSLVGRDATELIRTLPGFAVFNGGMIGNQSQDFTIVGTQGSAVSNGYNGNGLPYRGGTDLTFDGAHILDNGCNCVSTTTVNGDMVSEVKVQTSNFGADSAKGPLVVNAVGKSGTSTYHGEFYLHARDNTMNALDWAFKHQQQTSPKGLVPTPTGRFFFPGAQVGGPVPGTKKKLLFHSAFEYYYQHQIPLQGLTIPGLLTNTVPTASMRNGIFDLNPTVAPDNAAFCSSGGNSGQPVCQNSYDTTSTTQNPSGTSNFGWADSSGVPNTNTQNSIPVSSFNPGAAILLANVPAPNADPSKTGGFNYLFPENVDQNGWIWRNRVDYNLSENTKLYGSYQVQKEKDNVPVHLWWQPTNSIPFPGGMSSHDNSQTVSGHFVKIISPTLTNDFSTGLGYINYPLVKNSKGAWAAQTGGIAGQAYPYQGVYSTKSPMMPDIGDGYWIAGVPQMLQPDIFSNGEHFVWQKWNYSLEDNVTKSYKTHTFKAGFYYERTTNNQGAFGDYNGHYEAAVGFSGGQPFGNCNGGSAVCGSNNPVANFLLGVGTFDQVNQQPNDNLWYPTYSGFIQDDWKVMRKLTLNLGLRADHLGAWRAPNSFGVATWTGDLTTKVAGFTWHGLNSRIPLAGRDVSALTWQPRLGFAYDLRGNGKTVLRGGWGEYGYRDQWNDYQAPANLTQGVLQFNANTPVSLLYLNSLNGTLTATGSCGTPGNICGNTEGLLLSDHRQPLSRNYNFTISQQLPWSSLFEIGYVGSESLYGDLEGNFNNQDIRNINTVPIGALFAATGCAPLQANNPNGSNQNAGGGCTPSSLPGSVYPYFNQYGSSLLVIEQHKAKTNYNGLQASWVRQKGRITYNLNYTWSKALGTQGTPQLNGLPPDATNLAHDYGVLSVDRSHLFNFSYTFQTGSPLRGALGYLVNGWNLSGITTWQSGPDVSTLTSTNLGLGGIGPAWVDPLNIDPKTNQPKHGTYGIGNFNYLGTQNAQVQPTVTCNPTANLKTHQYFNASCFGVPNGGQNGPWQLPYLHGPAFFNSDLAIFKTFKVTERQSMEFRFSAFNFLNRPLDSFQGGSSGDNTLNFTYECGGVSAANDPACVNGMGSYVLTNAPPAQYKLTGSSVAPGYASTRYGRRVLEFSAKYSF